MKLAAFGASLGPACGAKPDSNAPMRTLCLGAGALALVSLAACGSAAMHAAAPAAAAFRGVDAVAGAPGPKGVFQATAVDSEALVTQADSDDDPSSLQSRALERCQRAKELLAKGDNAGAIAQVDEAYTLMLQMPDTGDDNAQAKQDIRLMVADVIGRVYKPQPEPDKTMASWDLGLPMINNEHVQAEIRSLTTTERPQFLAAYRRSGRYRPMILAKLDAAHLPHQLSWLPLVESFFKVSALSRASALGLWQFIASTGLRYGLSRNSWVDERLDPSKATDAAISYLSDLHRLFGDWQKALAAYNCGEGQILRLQKRSTTHYLGFWDLYGLLPRETRRYVPRLIAVLQIVKHPEKYDITLPPLDPPQPATDTITIDKAVKLSALDGALGLDGDTLEALNPELRHASTPTASYELRVPAGESSKALAAVTSLPIYVPPRPRYVVHRVRSGETLSTIAERYHTTVGRIMRFNRIHHANRIWAGQRLRIPIRS